MNIVDFLTKNLFGIILLSVAGGVIGFFISNLIVNLYRRISYGFKKKRNVKYLVKVGSTFASGCKTTFAKDQGSFHQALLVGDYLKDIVLSVGRILFYTIISIGFIIYFAEYWFSLPIIITIASIIISFEYKRLNECKNLYHEMFKYIYGDEYYQLEMKGIKEYWKSMSKKK